ncbi:pyrroloquinoline quinone biosynthesis protein [Synechococcus sp. CS-1325]|uniref:Coq4 family protein n=1 Tax=unclassified Synechococcus TaxID=2626047 RepID=UPI000DB30C56|nr:MULTISPECIES: Coq4 family protein [unclassified Synechococcus]PZU99715.1 MAG: pyrroloquinoline quinone biosynthesis protein [Cyanobium sp.]MCT0200518.1 pyrroloquinoline quinone biosynthesis protein [Synechococcus sp. CS-1325]MCT0213438.1 pyrroloquinoline quinone biosynthesis protein [Synechococcus sp. CS-1326]MCT0231676.1 pyrroloquinoline quinone biosynthesis protein [Synechococcus sp. CS-1324]MCT0232708.1 pyrroloquinoline quinone biosynthesis protein [Synechococcus sp. CS-1327]
MGFRYLDSIATQANLKEFLELTDLAVGGGADAGNVFLLSHRLRSSSPMKLCTTLLNRNPAAAELIKQRRLCGPYDADALRKLPRGTLGHTYATALGCLGYDINFFPEPTFYNNLETDADYINYRVFATHDIHHIISGFSLDGRGEIGVVSISVGQFNHPGLGFLDLVILLLTWLKSDVPLDQIEAVEHQARTARYTLGMILRGLEMAEQAQPLFPVLWEDRMGQDLEELRRELGIVAVKEGPMSWYSNPTITAALAA